MERVHYRRVAEPGTRRRGEPATEGMSDGRERLIMQGVVCAAMLAVVLAVRLIDTDLTSRLRTNLFHALSEQVSTERIAAGFQQIKDSLPGQNAKGSTEEKSLINNPINNTIHSDNGFGSDGKAVGDAVPEGYGETSAPIDNTASYDATAPYIDEDVLAELDASKLTVPELPVSPEP